MTVEEKRHDRMRRLFRGEIIPQPYHQITLRGAGQSDTGLLPYMALYTLRDIVYRRVKLESSPTKKYAIKQVCASRLPRERQAAHIPADSPEDLQTWGTGIQQTQFFGLPLMVVIWTQTLSGGEPKITLRYPSMVTAQWAFDYFRRGISGT